MRLFRTLVILGAVLAAVTFLALPPLFETFGLHPIYAGERHELRGGRALIITTSQGQFSPGNSATGVFASEMTGPYYVFKDAGLEVDVASIKGGAIPIDPISFLWFVETRDDKRFKLTPPSGERRRRPCASMMSMSRAMTSFTSLAAGARLMTWVCQTRLARRFQRRGRLDVSWAGCAMGRLACSRPLMKPERHW